VFAAAIRENLAHSGNFSGRTSRQSFFRFLPFGASIPLVLGSMAYALDAPFWPAVLLVWICFMPLLASGA
jgi:uncharacterized membrane protein YhaH (DUF805 family)